MAELRERCVCLTKQGTQCKNIASEGSLFCRVHQEKGCAKQVGEMMPEKRAPSPPRKAASSRRSSRASAAPTSTPPPEGLAYFDQLDDATATRICDKLAASGDCKNLASLAASNKRLERLCQPLLTALATPSFISPRGEKIWWDSQDRIHRDCDLPAFVSPDGTREWYWHGQRHREGDKPARIWADGTQEWWLNNQMHRENDQPAHVGRGGMRWMWRDELHREGDKPAIIYEDGQKEWWRHGRRYFPEGKPLQKPQKRMPKIQWTPPHDS